MKDYIATIRIEAHISAKDDDQAAERAEKLCNAYAPAFKTDAGNPAKTPVWVDDVDEQTVDEVTENE